MDTARLVVPGRIVEQSIRSKSTPIAHGSRIKPNWNKTDDTKRNRMRRGGQHRHVSELSELHESNDCTGLDVEGLAEIVPDPHDDLLLAAPQTAELGGEKVTERWKPLALALDGRAPTKAD